MKKKRNSRLGRICIIEIRFTFEKRKATHLRFAQLAAFARYAHRTDKSASYILKDIVYLPVRRTHNAYSFDTNVRGTF